MSSELEKFLAKITEKEKVVILGVIEKILSKDFKGLDLKKLSGYEDVFRVRKGNFRIIFKITKTDVKIIFVNKRKDTTYNF
jgi:mRNA-degrading endonuclease RelE of RelBE toxin-antitoxin system